jgi:hypothetical protein
MAASGTGTQLPVRYNTGFQTGILAEEISAKRGTRSASTGETARDWMDSSRCIGMSDKRNAVDDTAAGVDQTEQK